MKTGETWTLKLPNGRRNRVMDVQILKLEKQCPVHMDKTNDYNVHYRWLADNHEVSLCGERFLNSFDKVYDN